MSMLRYVFLENPYVLIPLLLMSFAFKFYYAWVVLTSARAEVLDRDKGAKWAAEVVEASEVRS